MAACSLVVYSTLRTVSNCATTYTDTYTCACEANKQGETTTSKKTSCSRYFLSFRSHRVFPCLQVHYFLFQTKHFTCIASEPGLCRPTRSSFGEAALHVNEEFNADMDHGKTGRKLYDRGKDVSTLRRLCQNGKETKERPLGPPQTLFRVSRQSLSFFLSRNFFCLSTCLSPADPSPKPDSGD
ncbi:hypothetical protein EDD16DRAFT_466261 [Pisolithus croceorrhizus]|nr:hypothetical protein EDD16DRAFT_466261 [Pisolithus croceorrhizus]KAI6159917.1 hypothetical protein EDD17DRAFT_1606951 [Pisolithus thermaeus]